MWAKGHWKKRCFQSSFLSRHKYKYKTQIYPMCLDIFFSIVLEVPVFSSLEAIRKSSPLTRLFASIWLGMP